MVNFGKSAITFCPSSSPQIIESIKRILGLEVVRSHDLYLGLPTFSLRSKRVQFSSLHDRVYQKINGWTSKLFSTGGKETLVKSVLQAIPTYAMSCFRIHVSLCHEIEQQCARFWWSKAAEKKGMHWTTWNSLCKPKSMGGLGFRSMVEFNKALLAKQIWRIIQNPNSLLARIFKSKYFRDTDIMGASKGFHSSFVWQSILWSRDVLIKGLFWKVGDGTSIQAFRDAWIPEFYSGKSLRGCNGDQNLRVKDFIDNDGIWNRAALKNCFTVVEVEAILKIPLHPYGGEDRRYWKHHNKEIYTVKIGYLAQLQLEQNSVSSPSNPHDWWKNIWKLDIPPKVRIFTWKAANNFIPTELNLAKHHVPILEGCTLCKHPKSNTCHSLFFCYYSKSVWKESCFGAFIKSARNLSFVDILYLVLKVFKEEQLELFCTLAWAVWGEICKLKNEVISKANPIQVHWVYAFLLEYRTTSSVGKNIKNSQANSIEKKWVKPCRGHLRLDVDVCFKDSIKKYSVGMVIRDHAGDIILAVAKPIHHPGSVLAGELWAILHGLQLCKHNDLQRVEVFSDSLNAVNAIKESSDFLGPDGILIAQISALLADEAFEGIRHVSRLANRVVHSLASFDCNSSSMFVWD